MIIWHVGGGGGGYGKAQELAESIVGSSLTVFEANADRRETSPANVRNECLGDVTGLVDFYVYEYESCSSIFKINSAHAQEITGNTKLKTWGDHDAIRETRAVQMHTIDYLICGLSGLYLQRPDFLSLDAQGAEHDILNGAKITLPYVLAVLTEFQTAEVYKGQGLFHDQAKFLHEHGFRLADIIYKEYWTRDGTRLLTAGDALFLNFNELTPERVEKRDRIAAFFGLRES